MFPLATDSDRLTNHGSLPTSGFNRAKKWRLNLLHAIEVGSTPFSMSDLTITCSSSRIQSMVCTFRKTSLKCQFFKYILKKLFENSKLHNNQNPSQTLKLETVHIFSFLFRFLQIIHSTCSQKYISN